MLCNPPLYSNVHSSLHNGICSSFCFLFHQLSWPQQESNWETNSGVKISWGKKPSLSLIRHRAWLERPGSNKQNDIRCAQKGVQQLNYSMLNQWLGQSKENFPSQSASHKWNWSHRFPLPKSIVEFPQTKSITWLTSSQPRRHHSSKI